MSRIGKTAFLLLNAAAMAAVTVSGAQAQAGQQLEQPQTLTPAQIEAIRKSKNKPAEMLVKTPPKRVPPPAGSEQTPPPSVVPGSPGGGDSGKRNIQ